MSFLSKNGWVCFFFFFLNGCEWKRVAGSGWERNSVKPVRKVLHLVN